jgi:hypothetical protein
LFIFCATRSTASKYLSYSTLNSEKFFLSGLILILSDKFLSFSACCFKTFLIGCHKAFSTSTVALISSADNHFLISIFSTGSVQVVRLSTIFIVLSSSTFSGVHFSNLNSSNDSAFLLNCDKSDGLTSIKSCICSDKYHTTQLSYLVISQVVDRSEYNFFQ